MDRLQLKKGLKYGVAIIILLLIFRAVNLTELYQALTFLTVELALALLAISFVMIYLSAYKWRIILSGLETQDGDNQSLPSSLRLFNLYLIGYFVNLIFPSYVGGDVVRSMQLGKQVGQARALAATVFERYTGLVSMVVLSTVCVWFVPGVTSQIVLSVLAIVLATMVGTLLALYPIPEGMLRRLPFGVGAKLYQAIAKLQSSFHLVRRKRNVVFSAFGLSFIFHCLTVLNTALAGAAVGWTDPSILQLFVVVPIILLIGAIPISPQGLGIQEGAFYYFLQIAGATPAQALGVALVLRVKSYVLALLGGSIWYAVRKKDLSSSS